MEEIPYEICDEDEQDELDCTEIQCHSRYDSVQHDFQDNSCPVDTSFRPIKCIKLIYQTPGRCVHGHDFGHNDSFIHVREGCEATFKACTDTTHNENDPPTAPPVIPPDDPPTTRRLPLQPPARQGGYNDDPNTLATGLAVGGGLIVVIAVVVLVMLYYRRRKHINDKRNKSGAHKKINVTSGDHVYTDITAVVTSGDRVYTDVTAVASTVRRPSGNYVTIADEVDKYDHCRPPSLDTDKQSEETDSYDTLTSNSRTMNVSVISDQTYDTTRDTTYDRLHTKENSSIPGAYDVLPVQTS